MSTQQNDRKGDIMGACKTTPVNKPPMYDKQRFVITVKGEDLDCVKKALTVINNCIYEEGNIISEYNVKLLNALLGENWTERYEFGKRFISDN